MHDSDKITQLLKTRNIGKNIICFDRLDSTNNYLKTAADSLPDGTVVMTREQFGGRGRRGRHWAATDNRSIAMSVLFKNSDFINIPSVSLICGLAVASALNYCCAKDFYIKWPNDIICENKKVCGILCEARITKTGVAVVCGIGINILQGADFFMEENLPEAASLALLSEKVPSHEQITAAILNKLEEASDLARNDSSSFYNAYSDMCCTLGKSVLITGEQDSFSGIAQSVNADGSLTVISDGKPVIVHAGEVSLRPIV